jgi:hypothetical protein
MSSNYDNPDDQTGPAVWADESTPTPPAMRTFKVVLDPMIPDQYVDAHSITCEGDAVKFYTYRVDWVEGVPMLVAFCTRVLRPYLDVEDVTVLMATTSKSMN